MANIMVRNDSDHDVVIPKKTRLGRILEYDANNYYLIDVLNIDLAAKQPRKRIN